jgi:ferredoxin
MHKTDQYMITMNFNQKKATGRMSTNPNDMANITDKLTNNVTGRFYVDSSCIDCNQCRDNASSFFTRDEETGLSIVFKQPETPEEIAEAQDALDGCPTDSIGNDGVVS